MKTKLVVFGITGELSISKLLPALEQIISTNDFKDISIMGITRQKDVKPKDLIQKALGNKKNNLENELDIFPMDLAETSDYVELKKRIGLEKDEQLLVYLSVPPRAATQIVSHLGETGINTPNVKILFEKPFGWNLESAKDMLADTARYFKDEQIYRIDHYLAKEMAQNIIAFRSSNALFSDVWSKEYIHSIVVTMGEPDRIYNRPSFDQLGSLRDVLQNHVLQLLALTIMDTPKNLDWDEMPKLRLRALKILETAKPENAMRAQYEGYQDDAQAPQSLTETFVSLTVFSNDPRWKGVPMRLTAGKALKEKTSEVRVRLCKKTDKSQCNEIVFRLDGTHTGVDMETFVETPGLKSDFEVRHLGLRFPEDAKLPEAYERVIADAITSRKSLFTSGEEVLESWRILRSVQDIWAIDSRPLKIYPVGSDINKIINT